MANKKGRSEKKTDWLGRSYIQHYDSRGNKSGKSERKETFFGKKYTQHYDARGEKRGRSEKKETWLGREYTQKYNTRGEKSGRSEKKETWLGSKYRQHYDSKGTKTDWSERKETWLGKPYVQRYGDERTDKGSKSSSPSSSAGYGGSTSTARSYPTGSSVPYSSPGISEAPISARSSGATSHPPRHVGRVLLVIALFVVVVYVGKSVLNSINFNPSRSNWARTSRTATVVPDKDLNLREGAGKQFRILMVIPRSSEVTVLSDSQYVQNELWVRVRFGSTEGWVHNSFLR